MIFLETFGERILGRGWRQQDAVMDVYSGEAGRSGVGWQWVGKLVVCAADGGSITEGPSWAFDRLPLVKREPWQDPGQQSVQGDHCGCRGECGPWGWKGRVCKTSWGPTKTLWWGLGSNIKQSKSSKPNRLINEHCVPLRGTVQQKVIILWKQELFTWNTFLRYHIANDNAWNSLSSGEGAVLVW